MFMIFGVCIWHAVIGGIIHPYYMDTTPVTATTTTARPLRTTNSTVSSNVTWPVAATTTQAPKPYNMYAYKKSTFTYKVASETQLADRVALGVVAGTFSTIHLGFFIAGGLSVSVFERYHIKPRIGPCLICAVSSEIRKYVSWWGYPPHIILGAQDILSSVKKALTEATYDTCRKAKVRSRYNVQDFRG